MATVSYGLKITEAYHIFDKTIAIYRNAVHYIMMLHINVSIRNFINFQVISDVMQSTLQSG